MERWKPVKGFEGLYEISDQGRVKSLCAGRWKKEIIRKTQVNMRTGGYVYVSLKKDGRYHNLQVHRLVAEAFLDNAGNLPQVNHKDENPLNNRFDNLEWCTSSYNNNYGAHPTKYYKPIVLVQGGNVIKRFQSIKAAATEYGIPASYISGVLSGRRSSTYGKQFAYAMEVK